MIVYDITDPNSFKGLDYWIDSIRKFNSDNIVIYLLGNKSDLGENLIFPDEISSFKSKNNLNYDFLVSAKDNTNIMGMFKQFYKEIYEVQREFLLKKTQQFKKLKEKRIQRGNETKKCC